MHKKIKTCQHLWKGVCADTMEKNILFRASYLSGNWSPPVNSLGTEYAYLPPEEKIVNPSNVQGVSNH
jgi:hypothetical protein